ncbi:MAG: DUF4286 family protein [Balneolia bacterium]|nr:DUF4286 family protein [Balneolia bacterium]
MIYAVTVHIEKESEHAWVVWMKSKHIPDVMATGLFLNCRMMRSELVLQKGYITYMMHYELADKEKFKEYEDKHAARLRNDVILNFDGRFIASRDLLEITARF